MLRNRCSFGPFLIAHQQRQAAELAYGSTGRIDRASVAVGAARIASGAEAIAYDEPVDLSGYDSVFFGRGA